MKSRIDRIFKNSKKLEIDDNSKIVIMSDCHRGSGNVYDNFLKNKSLFEAALLYYYRRGFTYIELGDGDEMWEVSNYKEIVEEHLDAFKKLREFNNSNRLIMIYGNHDIYKSSKKILEKNFYYYYNHESKEKEKLLDGLEVYESLILDYKGREIFLLHGHQADFFNSDLLTISKFLVRNIWRHIEKLGINDPTLAGKNYAVENRTEKKLEKWTKENNKILIAGHTHRPIFPKKGQSLYFNDGSCIHPNGITCIEIEKGKISLVKWSFKINSNEIITTGRDIIEGNEHIIDFFNK